MVTVPPFLPRPQGAPGPRFPLRQPVQGRRPLQPVLGTETRAPKASWGRLLPRSPPAGQETLVPRGRGRGRGGGRTDRRQGAQGGRSCRPAAWASLCPRTSALLSPWPPVPATWASLHPPHVEGPQHSPATPGTARAHAACSPGHPSPACHTTGRVRARTEALHDGLETRRRPEPHPASCQGPASRRARACLALKRRGMGGESHPRSSPIQRTKNKRQLELDFKELNGR